jgi:hypothetical protein
MNSVVVLFICDLDEQFYGILMVINPRWVHMFSIISSEKNDEAGNVNDRPPLPDDNSKVKRDVEVLKKEFKLFREHIAQEYGLVIPSVHNHPPPPDHDSKLKHDVEVLKRDFQLLKEKIALEHA